MVALQLLRTDIKPLSPEDTVQTALEVMEEYKVSHLPVIEGDIYLGVIGENLLLDATSDDLQLSIYKNGLPRAFIGADKHIFDAVNLFHEYNVSLLPVLDADENYMGYLHPQDIVMTMGGMLSSKIPGAILVLEVNQADYQMSQISQIIEGNDAKILACYITSTPNSPLLEITLRINRKDLTPILQTFQRYNYIISATYHESVHTLDLKDRYENFMKYLNM